MLKSVLLATSVMFAVPALAQETPADTTAPTQQTAPSTASTETPDSTQAAETAAPVATEQTPATADAQQAQTAPAQEAAPAQQAQTTTPAEPQSTAPTAAPAQQAQTAPQAQPGQQTTQGAGAAATTSDQVTQAVSREFGSYDKDTSGGLDQAEFKSWMGALRKASEPGFQAESPEATTWFGQAFTASDTDKDGSINQSELATFLTPKTGQ